MSDCEHGQPSWLSCRDCLEEAEHRQMEYTAELKGLLREVLKTHKRTLWGQSETYKRIEAALEENE